MELTEEDKKTLVDAARMMRYLHELVLKFADKAEGQELFKEELEAANLIRNLYDS